MAYFEKSWTTKYRSGSGSSYLGLKLTLKINVDEGTGAGTCNWVATTFIPTNESDYTYLVSRWNAPNYNEEGYANNYIEINKVKRWKLTDYRSTDTVYTTETRRTSGRVEYYSGNYSWGSKNMYSLAADYASGSFSFNTDDNGDFTFEAELSAWMYTSAESGHVTCGGKYSIHVDLGRKLWKWTSATGWQKVAYGHKNSDWSKKLHLKVWNSSTKTWTESK